MIDRLKSDPATARIPVIVIAAHPGWLAIVDRDQAARVLKKACPIWELQAAVEQEPAESEAAE